MGGKFDYNSTELIPPGLDGKVSLTLAFATLVQHLLIFLGSITTYALPPQNCLEEASFQGKFTWLMCSSTNAVLAMNRQSTNSNLALLDKCTTY